MLLWLWGGFVYTCIALASCDFTSHSSLVNIIKALAGMVMISIYVGAINQVIGK